MGYFKHTQSISRIVPKTQDIHIKQCQNTEIRSSKTPNKFSFKRIMFAKTKHSTVCETNKKYTKQSKHKQNLITCFKKFTQL